MADVAVRRPASFFRGIGAVGLVEVVLPPAVLAWLATVHPLWRAWPVLLLAMIATAGASALCWHLLRTAQNQLG